MKTTAFRHCYVAICALSLIVSACAYLPRQTPPATSKAASQAAAYAQKGDFASAATLYGQAARQSTQPRRSQLYLRAGRLAARAGNKQQAQQFYAKIDPDRLEDATRQQFAEKHPAIVGNWLSQTVQKYVQHSIWLLDPRKIKANNESIWQLLQRYPHALAHARGDNHVTQGWISLAKITAKQWSSPAARQMAIQQWQANYPHHPGNQFATGQAVGAGPLPTHNIPAGSAIGLALPMTGEFSGAAQAISNGFLTAFYNSGQAANHALHFYDMSKLGTVTALMQKAQSDGVKLLVGPLRKEKISALQKTTPGDLRILALNYATPTSQFPGFYQYGLSPEEQARAAAKRATLQGLNKAVVLVPLGNWGSRILSAFQQALQANGGTLLDYASYDPGNSNYGKPIRQLLPRRRHSKPAYPQGPDFVFIAARPTQARLICSQLRYYHAGQLPVFATSAAYDGTPQPRKNRDLDGLHLPVMPWLFSQKPEITRRHKQVRSAWNGANDRHPRLFAMGADAWTLALHLAESGLQPGDTFNGDTGTLSVLPSGRIQRQLSWAQFKGGKLEALPQTPSPAVTSPLGSNGSSDAN